jgi:LmbE family N-acetylglucosaminyl deacetylase
MEKPKKIEHISDNDKCAVIVAHPDDETLWAGGTILLHPQADWIVVSVCRASDPDRAPKFHKAVEKLGATGFIGDLDDGPDQQPLNHRQLRNTIIELLPTATFDLVITHGLWGEYTRHLRHEETGKAVMSLWETERLSAKTIWRFAYEDGGGKYLPRPMRDADVRFELPEQIWQKKYDIITKVYGFGPESFEARTTPHTEAFWVFKKS